MNIGIIGTTRKNAPGVPAHLLAAVHKYPDLIAPNHTHTAVIDDLITATAWHDSLRGKRLILLSTVHNISQKQVTSHKDKAKHKTRQTKEGFSYTRIQ